jgi:predicted transcriptional regulator
LLAQKRWLKFRRDGKRFLYRPAMGREKSRRNAVARLVETFFAGSPSDVLASMLSSTKNISDEEFQRMSELIEKARRDRP